jgi:hypothetical protein
MEKIQLLWEYIVLMLMAIFLLLNDSLKVALSKTNKGHLIKLFNNHYYANIYIFVSSIIYILGLSIFSILLSSIDKISIKNGIYHFYNC